SYSELEKYKESLQILRKMLTAPRFKNFVPQIKTEIANIYDQQGRQVEALDLYKEVVKERISNPGTAQASFNLAQIYENRLQNVDSAVYYYGQVEKIYSKYDSVQKAKDKHRFLSELKTLRDEIKKDQRLSYRLENEPSFRDSLYEAQMLDSLQKLVQPETPEMDTTSVADFTYPPDSLLKSTDSTIQKQREIRDEFETADPDLVEDPDSTLGSENEVIDRNDLFGSLENPEEQEQNQNRTRNQRNEGENPENEQPQIKPKVLEKRKLPEIKEDLKQNRYHIAEYFLLQVQNYDSALYYYKKFLNTYQDTILTPKAYYSMYYIFSQPDHRDSLKQDSLKSLLRNQYPESPFTRQMLKAPESEEQKEAVRDSLSQVGHRMFRNAERLYEENELDSALALYKKAAELDTSLFWSAKAQFARAWIFEHDLQNIDKAINEYETLANKYKEPEFTSLAQKKIATPRAEEENPAEAAGDSLEYLASADTTAVVEVAQNPLESTEAGLETDSNSDLPIITNKKDFIAWRISRLKFD
ncbi:MAG: tetratricopeptide repeat protein, partial [Calditrichia bacterium]